MEVEIVLPPDQLAEPGGLVGRKPRSFNLQFGQGPAGHCGVGFLPEADAIVRVFGVLSPGEACAKQVDGAEPAIIGIADERPGDRSTVRPEGGDGFLDPGFGFDRRGSDDHDAPGELADVGHELVEPGEERLHAFGPVVGRDGSVFEKDDRWLDPLELVHEAAVALGGTAEIAARGGRGRVPGPSEVVEPQSPVGPARGQCRLEVIVPDALLGELRADEDHRVAIDELERQARIVSGNRFGGVDGRGSDEDEDRCTEPSVSGHAGRLGV